MIYLGMLMEIYFFARMVALRVLITAVKSDKKIKTALHADFFSIHVRKYDVDCLTKNVI